jgi:hypothetical protein
MRATTISVESEILNDLLQKARREDLILQAADGEQFVLARVTDMQAFYVGSSDDFEQEVVTARKNKKLMKFLDERGAARETGKGIPFAEVRRRLGLSPGSERSE